MNFMFIQCTFLFEAIVRQAMQDMILLSRETGRA